VTEHPSADLNTVRRLAAAVDTTALCDAAGDIRVMSPALRCRSANPVLCGPALTVRCRDDFLGVIQAIERARPGDVLVVDGGGRETALAGELFARAALARELAGIIVDGGYRDLRFVATCPLPVYSRHVSPKAGTTSRPAPVGETVSCGGVPVARGDIVIADHDGIVVLDPATALAQLNAAAGVMAVEQRIVERLAAGAGIGDCVNLTEHVELLTRGEPSRLRFTV
jgi:regulator of RNase E activity RraA